MRTSTFISSFSVWSCDCFYSLDTATVHRTNLLPHLHTGQVGLDQFDLFDQLIYPKTTGCVSNTLPYFLNAFKPSSSLVLFVKQGIQVPCLFLICHSANTDCHFQICSKSKDSSLRRSPLVLIQYPCPPQSRGKLYSYNYSFYCFYYCWCHYY